ncbi:protein ORF4 [Lizard adenovirus 2]|uniref:Protein ORF4 n=1 Tax=Lizard adenovirus 2 TaxID=874272 RepID=A0A076FTH5_9ADEN|nr:protein ORF4 [Lizard adenovirus 2]AII22590.1 protein ORF4 [Lizard adenovirus 2]
MEVFNVFPRSVRSAGSFSFFDLRGGAKLIKNGNRHMLQIKDLNLDNDHLQCALKALEDNFPVVANGDPSQVVIGRLVERSVFCSIPGWYEFWWAATLDFFIACLSEELGGSTFDIEWRLDRDCGSNLD